MLCVVLTILGVLLVPVMLRMMQTPADVEQPAAEYLQIYFAGLSGLLLYNLGSGILSAVGDTRRPLYFLMLSALTNTVLDLLFVAEFHMGIAGAAIATILAQALSAVLVMVVLCRSKSEYRIILRDIRFHKATLKRVCSIGLPSAIQQSVTAFSNVFVQSYVNRFGSSCMAGWTSYQKIDSFALLPLTSIAMATTTFVGQNLGAGNKKRAHEGTRCAFLLALGSTVVLLIPLMLFAPQLIGLFNRDQGVLYYGTLFIRMISPFYLASTVNQILSGSLRGAGATKVPMLIMLGSFVVFRQIYLFVTYRLFGTIVPIALGYPIGWVLCSVLIYLYYRKRTKRRID